MTKKNKNPWIKHVESVRMKNPDLKFKEVLKKAKKSYTKIEK